MDQLIDIPDFDDWTQRLKETPYDPLEEVRQENETFLTELESLAVYALATNKWNDFFAFVEPYRCKSTQPMTTVEAIAADELHNPSSDPSKTTANESNRLDCTHYERNDTRSCRKSAH